MYRWVLVLPFTPFPFPIVGDGPAAFALFDVARSPPSKFTAYRTPPFFKLAHPPVRPLGGGGGARFQVALFQGCFFQ